MSALVLYATTWVHAHAKTIGLVGAVASSVGGAAVGLHEYNRKLVTRIDTIETRDVQTDSSIAHNLDEMKLMLSETRCMVIQHHSGEDPLTCLTNNGL